MIPRYGEAWFGGSVRITHYYCTVHGPPPVGERVDGTRYTALSCTVR